MRYGSPNSSPSGMRRAREGKRLLTLILPSIMLYCDFVASLLTDNIILIRNCIGKRRAGGADCCASPMT